MSRRSRLKGVLASIGEYLAYVAIIISFTFSLFAAPLLICTLITPTHVEYNITQTLIQFLIVTVIITSPLTLAPLIIAIGDELEKRKRTKQNKNTKKTQAQS